jgi:hypothetical protein
MPIQINHGVKGKEYPPYAVTVERGKIKEFARPSASRVVAKRPPKEDDGPRLVDLELWAENQKGEKVITSKATAALSSRG